MPSTLFDKIWDAHEVAPGLLYIDLHLVHEVTSPQAFDGLRLAGRKVRRPGPHARDGRPQRADRRHAGRRAHQRRARRVQVETLERNCEEFGVPRLLARLRPPGHRPRDRAGAGRHAAGHDDRLRRLAHRHARRVRRARVRHRHERGRARARDAVASSRSKPKSMRDPLRRRARLRRHREGPDPRHDRPDRRRPAPPATSSSTPARRSRRSRWRAA